ncbi:hypothetical protein C7C46_15705 [Streptomyces tateyamensis]|uniref:Uncharacterized protein n=1 Tax=Streptomyces tateyamensis TaxID=565073 RepID=A0A2V4N3L3_9ACTN|nr:hypothetical protein C7C46_15705 [Streptomyces tateyamensis]
MYRALVDGGRAYVCPPPPAGAPDPTGPPPGHPERLCPHVALSPLEARLARELWGRTPLRFR